MLMESGDTGSAGSLSPHPTPSADTKALGVEVDTALRTYLGEEARTTQLKCSVAGGKIQPTGRFALRGISNDPWSSQVARKHIKVHLPPVKITSAASFFRLVVAAKRNSGIRFAH